MHIVLLGDSTFDNRAYTEGGPDVVAHLRSFLVGSDRATLLAVDGGVMASLPRQLDRVRGMLQEARAARERGESPEEEAPTHLALSVGGNDLLGELALFDADVGSVGEALLAVRERATAFGTAYRDVLDETVALARAHDLKVVICTVYQGAFENPAEAAAIETALRVFDHEILTAGLERDIPVVDLRRVCNEPGDYWNPIEPSERGGRKIAGAVLAALRAPRYDVDGAVTWQGTAGLGDAAKGASR